jgi:hypothetical protein
LVFLPLVKLCNGGLRQAAVSRVMFLFRVGTWKLWKLDHKYLESFEMWCWTRTTNICRTDCGKNEEGLKTVKEEKNSLHRVKKEV